MNLKPYPKYKDSGIEWLGEIPEGWEVKRLKWIARLEYGSSLSGDSREGGIVPVYGSNGVVGEHSKSITDKPVIIIGRKGSYGKVSYSDVPCFPIDTTYYIDPGLTKENIRWLYYLLSSMELDEITFDTGVPGLSREFAYAKVVPFPSKIEQTVIANFLDHKTAKIDELIKKNKRLIELLKEKRQAIISHAVTKGLAPDAKMKDSGIEWIGEIPERWEVRKLKYCDLVIMGQSPNSDDYNTTLVGLPFLQGNADFTELHPIPRIWCDTANKLAEGGDILLSVRAPIGAVNIADQKYGIGRGLCAIHAINSFQKYLYYVALCLHDELNSIGTGSTYTAVSVDEIKNVVIPQPPSLEQQSIANFLDQKTARIDETIKKIQSQIEKLKEYRQTLISNVVTGKVRVG